MNNPKTATDHIASPDFYKVNIKKYDTIISKSTKSLNKISALRLVSFIFSVIIVTFLIYEELLVLIFLAVPLFIIVFGILITRYNKVVHKKKHNTFLKELNEDELLKSAHSLSKFDNGQRFIDHQHPYTSDLDIFGQHSLFQLINRTTTESGSAMLSEWLKSPASNKVIADRQAAVKELTPRVEWRQNFQAFGMHFKNSKSDYNKLLHWIDTSPRLLPNKTKYQLLGILLSTLSILSIAFYFYSILYTTDLYTGIIPLAVVILMNYQVIKRVGPVAEEIIDHTHTNIHILGGYYALINKIESEKFETPLLQQIRSAFSQHGYSATNEINRLRKVLRGFQLRGTKNTKSMGRNLFYPFINVFLLLDIYYILKTEQWKVKNKSHLKSWAFSVSEFETLNSIAGFHYSNPDFTFPQLKDEPYEICFEMVGHPLIKNKNRVYNNFRLNERGHITTITGSNMAGKSTFLRTIGINLVLAFMGAPCCAKSGEISNMKVFTSMRTIDNLEGGISSFYAELKRIEQLLTLINSGEAIFFLLDEMFKGTNSEDRHKGGISLIKQLSELNAFGIISTHDLSLATLAKHHALTTNYSFNSKIADGEMTFNYKLTDGICTDFNASELMKKSGIKILSNIEDML